MLEQDFNDAIRYDAILYLTWNLRFMTSVILGQ